MYFKQLTAIALFYSSSLITQIAGSGFDDSATACFSINAACNLAKNLEDTCVDESKDKMASCLCQKGWVDIAQACIWCKMNHDSGVLLDLQVTALANSKSVCSAAKVTIAPMPSNVKSKFLAFNATKTFDNDSEDGSATTKKHSTTSTPKITGASDTYFGGTTAIRSFNAGPDAPPTAWGTAIPTETGAGAVETKKASNSGSSDFRGGKGGLNTLLAAFVCASSIATWIM